VFSFAAADPGPCFSMLRSRCGWMVVSTDEVLFV